MGMEVGDVADPVETLVESCEAVDLGDTGTDMAGEAQGVLDSNGHLAGEEEGAEAEATAAAPIEPVAEVATSSAEERAADVAVASRSPVKDWSDFNAVIGKTFGEQRFGSFSDLLDPQQDASAIPSGEPGSDIDFFALVESSEPRATTSPEEIAVAPAVPPPRVETFTFEQPVAAWSDPTTDAAAAGAETPSAIAADPYPGWYYDHAAEQWREVADYSAGAGPAAAEDLPDAHQSFSPSLAEQAAEIGLEQPQVQSQAESQVQSQAQSQVQSQAQSQAWDTQSTATQTVADEYPGWRWDYAAQTWVAVPDYNEAPSSSSWQTSSEAQSMPHSGTESWYGHQEQQTAPQQQQQQAFDNDPANVVSGQTGGFSAEYTPDSTRNATGSGYSSQMTSAVNTGLGFSHDTQQLHGETPAAGWASGSYFPHANGEQFASPSMLSDSSSYASSEAYYNYAANGGSNRSYSQQNYQQQQQQQAWGSGAQFNQYQQFSNPNAPPPKNVHEAMRTCSGRPPISLAAFGFGGQFIFMKHRDPVTLHTSNGDQAFASGEAWMPGPIQVSNLKTHLPEEPAFAGPLMGGGSVKELNKWIDERMASQSPYDSSRLLLGVLKVACQHYGKLRSSNVNSGNPAVEEDGPEAALAKLLTGSGGEQGPFAGFTNRSPPMRGVPVEQQLQGTALEVKKLLVCGKRKDALKCAQEGELWGIALLIGRQLGEKFFCDTVAEMARRQFAAGSPLCTLSLLLAGQPAEVFATPMSQSGNAMGGVPVASNQSQDGQEAMLDDWQENLAIMAANRTQGDERVMMHLGDRLWGVRGEVAAAHLCYLVADANLESYSGNARVCLIGADHCKNPRTFVSAEAIQRTEIYEYAKVLGNPQSTLLSFQPYKLIYAEMLVESGKSKDALKYCQTVLKSLKSAGMRSPEVEVCRIHAANLEERLRGHMQDGYGSNLAPRKLVNKIKGTMDWGISKLIGGPPTAHAATDSFGYRPLDNGDHFGGQTSRPGSSAGQRSGSLVPSASIAASMERLPQEPNRGPARSQSVPDFGRNATQGDPEGVSPRAAGLRLAGLGRLGSNILSRATGLWSSGKKEAKLGDANKFYYDEKLKKWVEEGVDSAPEVAPPPPPPTSSSFMAPVPSPEESNAPPSAPTSKPGTPPLAPSSNSYYSNRRQSGGVRSRYVDTFNKGGSVSPAKSVMGSLLPPTMPGGGMTSTAAMFVPAPIPSTSLSGNNNSDVGDSFVGVPSRQDDASSLSDTANSNGNTGDFASYVKPPVFGASHTRSSSWGGYPSSFNSLVLSEQDDGFGASLGGSEHAAAAVSLAPSAYSNLYLPNGNASLPCPPSLGSGEMRGSDRQFMGQQPFRASQSVDSLSGEDMQEVEL